MDTFKQIQVEISVSESGMVAGPRQADLSNSETADMHKCL